MFAVQWFRITIYTLIKYILRSIHALCVTASVRIRLVHALSITVLVRLTPSPGSMCYSVGSVTLGLCTKCKGIGSIFARFALLVLQRRFRLRSVYALSAKLSSGFLCSVRASSAMASVRLRTVYALSAKTSV